MLRAQKQTHIQIPDLKKKKRHFRALERNVFSINGARRNAENYMDLSLNSLSKNQLQQSQIPNSLEKENYKVFKIRERKNFLSKI